MIKRDTKILDEYFDDFKKIINFNSDEIKKKLINLKKIFITTKKNRKKILIFGNGGSAAIASHFSVDLTKNAKIRCTNYNESDLITCFSNDFGYERWVEMAIKYYGNKGDVLIVISSSGKSKNMINACIAAKNNNFILKCTLHYFYSNKLYYLIMNRFGSISFSSLRIPIISNYPNRCQDSDDGNHY